MLFCECLRRVKIEVLPSVGAFWLKVIMLEKYCIPYLTVNVVFILSTEFSCNTLLPLVIKELRPYLSISHGIIQEILFELVQKLLANITVLLLPKLHSKFAWILNQCTWGSLNYRGFKRYVLFFLKSVLYELVFNNQCGNCLKF